MVQGTRPGPSRSQMRRCMSRCLSQEKGASEGATRARRHTARRGQAERSIPELDHRRLCNIALQASAVTAAPVEIATLADRPKLHTALRQLIKGAYFGEHHEVAILSKAGLLLMVTARQGATASLLMMLRRDGQMAIADGDGKLRITEASIDLISAGMTSLDAETIGDVLAHLRQTRV
jgi:hypothetical protein